MGRAGSFKVGGWGAVIESAWGWGGQLCGTTARVVRRQLPLSVGYLLPSSPTSIQMSKLGPDPLRPDDDGERFWARVQASKKPIGLLLMDQTAVAGETRRFREGEGRRQHDTRWWCSCEEWRLKKTPGSTWPSVCSNNSVCLAVALASACLFLASCVP